MRRGLTGRRKWGALLLSVSALFLWAALGKASDWLLLVRLRATTARLGSIEERWAGPALTAWRETVTYAPVAGVLRLRAREGERLRVGDPVCEVGSVVVKASSAGVVSYYLDGREQAHPPGSPLVEIGRSQVPDLAAKRENGECVDAGAPLFRVVDNHEWSIFLSVEGETPLSKGQSVHVTTPLGEVAAYVSQVEERDKRWLCEVVCGRFYPELLNVRTFEATVSRGRHEGIIVPRSSLVEDEKTGRHGVYVLVAGRPTYRSTTIQGVNSSQALVTGVPDGARVVSNPRLLSGRNSGG